MKTIAPRAFNSLQIDYTAGTITKRSKNVEKFIDEINYVSLLPDSLSQFFPRVLDSSVDPANPYVTMEYYGYPTLAELYVCDHVDKETWSSVFSHLHSVLVDYFGAYERDVSAEAVHEMYVGKLRSRLETMRQSSHLSELVDSDYVVVNGRKIDNLSVLWEAIDYEMSTIVKNTSGSIVHGDFCFSNILYDVESHVCRFIDPRGSFGNLKPGVEGDLRYDIAKLWHSVSGMYDFITADKFTLRRISDTEVDMTIAAGAKSLIVSDAFADVFFSTWSRKEIDIICGLMLCSIPALHYDHPERQVAMYIRGLQLLNEGING